MYRLTHRAAHGGNAANLVDRRSDDGEIEALLAADVAVEDLAEMEPEIHFGRRQAFLEPARVQGSDRLSRGSCGVERGRASATAFLGREDRKHAIADQLQDVAGMLVDRRDDGLGVVVEQRNDL